MAQPEAFPGGRVSTFPSPILERICKVRSIHGQRGTRGFQTGLVRLSVGVVSACKFVYTISTRTSVKARSRST